MEERKVAVIGAGPCGLPACKTLDEFGIDYECLEASDSAGGIWNVESGPGGGYRLSRESTDISIADVIKAVDEMVDATRCGGMQNCQGEARCLTHDLWHDLSDQIQDFLTGIDLAQLVERRSVREVAARQDSIVVDTPQSGSIGNRLHDLTSGAT